MSFHERAGIGVMHCMHASEVPPSFLIVSIGADSWFVVVVICCSRKLDLTVSDDGDR